MSSSCNNLLVMQMPCCFKQTTQISLTKHYLEMLKVNLWVDKNGLEKLKLQWALDQTCY